MGRIRNEDPVRSFFHLEVESASPYLPSFARQRRISRQSRATPWEAIQDKSVRPLFSIFRMKSRDFPSHFSILQKNGKPQNMIKQNNYGLK